jgi:hypothetical protein
LRHLRPKPFIRKFVDADKQEFTFESLDKKNRLEYASLWEP